MLSFVFGLVIRRGVRRINAGDIGPMLGNYANNALLVFPGDHSWGGTYNGKASIEEFLNRCVHAGLKFEVQDIVASGWPWSARLCIRLTDRALSPDGTEVYSNRAVIFAKTSWGKIIYQEDYEDTQKVQAFDEYLLAAQGTAPANV